MSILKGQPSQLNYLTFDGNDKEGANNYIGSYPFTLYAKLKNVNGGVPIQLTAGNTNVIYYGIRTSSNSVSVETRNTTQYTMSLNVDWSDWVYIHAVYENNTSRKLYVNGVLVNSQSENVSFSSSVSRTSLFASWRSSTYNYYDGNISEIQVWSKSLSENEINNYISSQPVGNESNLELYYKFDEGSGTTLNDSSVNQNDVTTANGVWNSETVTPAIENIYYGSSLVPRAYLGETLVYGTPPQWNTFATFQKSDKNASPWTIINDRDWWAPTLNNSTIYAQQWRVVATAQTGQTSNEYWQELELVDYDLNTYNSVAASNLSASGYIITRNYDPSKAFDNDFSLPGGTFAASFSSGDHVGSTMSFDFNSPIRLNVIRLQTNYTKISQMKVEYFG